MHEGDYYVYGGSEMRVGYISDGRSDELEMAVGSLEANGGTLVVGDSREDATDMLLTHPFDGAKTYMQNRRGAVADARLPYFALRDVQSVALVHEDMTHASKTVQEFASVMLGAAQSKDSSQPSMSVFMKDGELRFSQRTIQDFAEYAAQSQPTRRGMRSAVQRLVMELATLNDAPFEIDESEVLQYVDYRNGEPYVCINGLRRVILERGYLNDAPNTSLGLLTPICQKVLSRHEPAPKPQSVQELIANRDVIANRYYILEQGVTAYSAAVEAVRAQVFVDALRDLPPIACSDIVLENGKPQYLAEVSFTTKYIAARVASGLVQANLAE